MPKSLSLASPRAARRFGSDCEPRALGGGSRLSSRPVSFVTMTRQIDGSNQEGIILMTKSDLISTIADAAGCSKGAAEAAYQPVAEVPLWSAGVGGNGYDKDGKPVGRHCDEDDRGGLLGVDEQQIGECTCRRLSWGSGPDQQPHQDAEIVAGSVDQVAFVNVFASAQPSPPHAASVEIVGKGPLDDFRPQPHRFLADPRTETGAIGIDRRPRLVVAVPA